MSPRSISCGSRVRRRRFDFAGVLTQFRRNIVQLQLGINLFLAPSRDLPLRLSSVAIVYSFRVQPMSLARPRRRHVVFF